MDLYPISSRIQAASFVGVMPKKNYSVCRGGYKTNKNTTSTTGQRTGATTAIVMIKQVNSDISIVGGNKIDGAVCTTYFCEMCASTSAGTSGYVLETSPLLEKFTRNQPQTLPLARIMCARVFLAGNRYLSLYVVWVQWVWINGCRDKECVNFAALTSKYHYPVVLAQRGTLVQ